MESSRLRPHKAASDSVASRAMCLLYKVYERKTDHKMIIRQRQRRLTSLRP